MRWFFHSKGRANSRFGDGTLSLDAPGDEPPDLFTADPMAPTASIGGHSCCLNFVAPMGPADQRAAEEFNSVLVYTSEPLAEPMELIGDVIGHALRRDVRARHRLDGATLRGLPGRPLDQPARRYRAGALPGQPLRAFVTGAGSRLLL